MMNRTELLRLRKEYEFHMDRHPSERWAAKLECVNFILGWHENEAGGVPAQGASGGFAVSRQTSPGTGPTPGASSRREGATAGGA